LWEQRRGGRDIVTTKQQVERLHKAGLTPREIATTLGRSTQIVYRHLASLGVSPNPRRTASSA